MTKLYIRKQMLGYRLAVVFWIMSPFFVLYLTSQFPGAGFVWDLSNALGFGGFGLCLYLFIETGRPRVEPKFEGKFFLHLHRNIAILVLALSTAHGLSLLIFDSTVIEYLKLTAPIYMLAAIGGWLLMLVLVVTSFKSIRVWLFSNHKSYRLIHGILSIACVYLVWYHIVDSRFYFVSYLSQVSGALFVAALLFYYGINRGRDYHRFFSRLKGVSNLEMKEHRIIRTRRMVIPIVVLACSMSLVLALIFMALQNVQFFEK